MTLVGGPRVPYTTRGLIGVWDFNNPLSYPGSGTDVFDRSGYESDGTIINSPLIYGTEPRGYVQFDGSTQYIDLGTPEILFPTTGITLSAWINKGVYSFGRQAIIANNHPAFAGTFFGYRLQVTVGSNNWIYSSFQLADGSSNTTVSYDSGINAQLNTWYHITGTWDGSTMTIYINGTTYTNTTSFSGPIAYDKTIASSIAVQRIGFFDFEGKMTLVTMYNRALTSDEVNQNYNLLKNVLNA